MHDVQLYNRMKNVKGTISRKEAYSFRSIIHCSLFIIHCSLFIIHYSLNQTAPVVQCSSP